MMRCLQRPLAALLMALCASLGHGQDPQETERRLNELKNQMERVQRQLERQQRRRGEEASALRDTERRIGQLEREIRETRTRLEREQRRLSELESEQEELRAELREQEEWIGRQILAAYQLGGEQHLKLLLNQEDPERLSRTLAYYDYFNRARLERIERHMETVRELEAIAPRIAESARELERNQDRLQRAHADLSEEQTRREQTLARLDQDISRKDRELELLGEEEQELQQLLERLRSEIADLPMPEDYQPFTSRRGEMPWPVSGRRLNAYGGERGGSLRWQGIQIAASAGSDVKAIHHGRVVFADWLRGAGLLIILDHGDGYMSLYGHNQSLLHDIGDWVSAGEVIATVGNSGGRAEAALYFEIRHNGRPADPVVWCRS